MVKALIIIDMINAYKKDIYADKKILRNQLKLVKEFQDKKLLVISATPGGKVKKNPVMLHLWGNEMKGDEKRKSGKKLQDLILELQKVKWNKIIKKPEYSAFFRTDLDKYLIKNKVSELYLAGIYSGVCVHYTGVDAAQRGIWSYLVTDASTTENKKWHKDNCKRFSQVVGKIIKTKEVIGTLDN